MLRAAMSLYEAVLAGDAQAVVEALKSTKDVNVLGPENRTPLIEAAAMGRADLVEVLLAAGAEPTWKDSTEETAILKAAANGHSHVVQLLLGSASDDERDMARAFLAAFGKSHGPEYQVDASAFQKKAVEIAARAAGFVGDEDPLKRLERQKRSEILKKK